MTIEKFCAFNKFPKCQRIGAIEFTYKGKVLHLCNRHRRIILDKISKQEKMIQKAVKKLETSGTLYIHINGENYHDKIYLQRDPTDKLIYVKYETTCKLVTPTEWEKEEHPINVIRKYVDYL